jgi:CRISPR-associated protein Csd1
MLKLLAEYAQKHGVESEPGFKSKYIRWAVVFDSQKGFLGVQALGDKKGRFFKKCPDLSQMEMVSGKETRSQFLVDDADVIIGNKAERYTYFVRLMEEAGKTSLKLASIAHWLNDVNTLEAVKQEFNAKKIRGSEDVTIIIDGEFPLEHDYWHDWWREFRRPLVRKVNKDRRCFVTGEVTQPMATHYKIEGLIGGRSTGDALVGFDKEAFRSYGLEQSENAAISEKAMCAYRAGLNDLINRHGQRLTGVTTVHWFKEKVRDDEDPLPWLQGALETPEQAELDAQHRARKLLESIKTGERADLAKNIYYVMTLSGADGRVMVRDWIEGQFEELAKNICAWFDDLEIVSFSDTRSARSPKLESVVTSLLPPRRNQNYEDWVKPVGSARVELLRSAIKGLFIPFSIISRLATVHRAFILSEEWNKLIKGERDASTGLIYSMLYARMGLIKAYHLRKNRKEGNTLTEELKPALNENYPNPAYQCGRLMAVLAELQRAALGDVGAGVIQRYYASASTTPALVLGRLTRTSQFHLDKLETRLAYWYEGKIADIWSRIKSGVPRTLSLEEQSLFALGYYQQLADMRTKKSEKSGKEESNG